MNMHDLGNAIKAQLYDRVASPLTGAFLVSWLLWNWQFLLILFSSEKVAEKYFLLITVVFPTLESILLRGLLLPLLTAAFFLFLYPYPSRWVYRIHRNHQKHLKAIQQAIDDETPLTREEAREIRRRATTQQLEFDRQLRDGNETLARLKQRIVELEESLSASQQREIAAAAKAEPPIVTTVDVQEIQRQVDNYVPGPLETEALSLIAEAGKLKHDEVISRIGHGRIKAEHALDELLAHRLIEQSMVDGRVGYSASARGRKVLIERDSS